MLSPLAHGDLVHDGYSEPAQERGAKQGLPALKVRRLHLILLMLVEDVPLELS